MFSFKTILWNVWRSAVYFQLIFIQTDYSKPSLHAPRWGRSREAWRRHNKYSLFLVYFGIYLNFKRVWLVLLLTDAFLIRRSTSRRLLLDVYVQTPTYQRFFIPMILRPDAFMQRCIYDPILFTSRRPVQYFQTSEQFHVSNNNIKMTKIDGE